MCDVCGARRAFPSSDTRTGPGADGATGAVTGIAVGAAGLTANAAEAPAGSIPPGTSGTLLASGFKLGSRYTVLKLLGRGGMGAVYKAWDDELGVAVAIKTIRPEAGADPEANRDLEQRFKREILLARQVTHKNVVRIYDIGEVDGLKYITMSFVEGETLGARLRRTGPLPVNETLLLGRQIAEGLVAAHEVGVIHRDLKPENIMVTPLGHALIMDFGIARSTGSATVSAMGMVVGTLEYMAPEQIRGSSVDQRTDIYAFGLMVYDMLVGRQRILGRDQPMTELLERTQAPPPAARTLRLDLPEDLDRIVTRCIQPDPDARFPSTHALVEALAGLATDGHRRRNATVPVPVARATPSWRGRALVGAAVLAIAAGGVLLWRGGLATTPATPQEPVSLLIADFENKTGDVVFEGVVEQALSLGVESASFITAYPRRDALRVATTNKLGSRLDETTARLVARREGVDVILAGTVEPNGTAYRITAKGVGAGNEGPTLYALEVSADGKATVLEAVGSLAGKVREALGDTRVPTGRAVTNETFTAASLEAARAYALAQELQGAGKRDEAITQYEEAIRLDPEFGRAYSGLAVQHSNAGRVADAEKYYQAALARTGRMTDREKYRTRGAYFLFARQPEQALEQFTELLKAFPGDDTGMTNSALAQFYLRRFALALEQGRKAAAMQPSNVTRRSNLALYAMYAGQFEAAITEAEHALTLNRSAVRPFVARALSQLALGRTTDASTTYAKLATLSPEGSSFATLGLADMAMHDGRVADAVVLLEKGIAQDVARKETAREAGKRVALAEARLARGDMAGAVRDAQAAVATANIDAVRLGAGLVLARAAGTGAEAEALAATLESKLESDPQSYGRLLRAELALAQGQPRAAVDHARAAQRLADTWLGRVTLGRAYLAVGRFTDAHTELEVAARRKGEATAFLLDEVPTYRLLPPVYYYIGVSQDGLKSPDAIESFKTFLAIKQHGGETDGLVADARKRLAR